jgi:hypothetical protein
MATSTRSENPDFYLSTLLAGRFDRPSLRVTFQGVRVSDLSGMTLETFVGSLRQKDQLIGRAFWTVVLEPVRRAWQEWESIGAARTTVDMARSKLTVAIDGARRAGSDSDGAGNPY